MHVLVANRAPTLAFEIDLGGVVAEPPLATKAPTGRRPTARQSASFAPCSLAGPTVRSTAQAKNGQRRLTAGSGTTTIDADTQPLVTNPRSAGPTCSGLTARRASGGPSLSCWTALSVYEASSRRYSRSHIFRAERKAVSVNPSSDRTTLPEQGASIASAQIAAFHRLIDARLVRTSPQSSASRRGAGYNRISQDRDASGARACPRHRNEALSTGVFRPVRLKWPTTDRKQSGTR
jgi:hypothetical protein